MRLLITGATGYIGNHLCQHLAHHQIDAVSLRQQPPASLPLQHIDCLIHLSGIVHQPTAHAAEYQRINVDQTVELAQRAKAAGVQHFIFFSSLAVYGGHGTLGPTAALTERSTCNPTSAYGRSKLQAEQALLAMASAQFKIAIIRPPMVYGAACPGNMTRLNNLLARLPLQPFGWAHNQRSLVAIENLCAMTRCIVEQRAAGVFLPQDPTPLSIATICTLLRQAQQQPVRLLPMPALLIRLAHTLKPHAVASLFGSLYVDNQQSCQQLRFNPPLSTQQAFENMCRDNK